VTAWVVDARVVSAVKVFVYTFVRVFCERVPICVISNSEKTLHLWSNVHVGDVALIKLGIHDSCNSFLPALAGQATSSRLE
jgi:hypothetical protein